ncbi:translation initiation factor IF-2, partial [Klebsiella pneumoniae]
LQVNGEITSTGDQLAGGISQIGHIHGGVEPGGGSTGAPQ